MRIPKTTIDFNLFLSRFYQDQAMFIKKTSGMLGENVEER